MRGATIGIYKKVDYEVFQSTLPMRGATGDPHVFYPLQFYFNPRSPCGERPYAYFSGLQAMRFQSTLPMRGATHNRDIMILFRYISIHAPHAGSDL